MPGGNFMRDLSSEYLYVYIYFMRVISCEISHRITPPDLKIQGGNVMLISLPHFSQKLLVCQPQRYRDSLCVDTLSQRLHLAYPCDAAGVSPRHYRLTSPL